MIFQSRVVFQQKGERNFHSFYQLIMGATEQKLAEMRLKRNPDAYHYIRQGGDPKVSLILIHTIIYAKEEILRLA